MKTKANQAQVNTEGMVLRVIESTDKIKVAPFKREQKSRLNKHIRSRQNVCMNPDWKNLCGMATREIEATLAELPVPLREQALKLPVTFEPIPNVGLQNDGIAPDTLGVFTGAEMAGAENEVMPTQITLFLKNIWEFSDEIPEVFQKEVRTTFLHELGHFFGLDEEDLADRGLE